LCPASASSAIEAAFDQYEPGIEHDAQRERAAEAGRRVVVPMPVPVTMSMIMIMRMGMAVRMIGVCVRRVAGVIVTHSGPLPQQPLPRQLCRAATNTRDVASGQHRGRHY
jgi:hypothetical protein